jgi:hypothetical protein
MALEQHGGLKIGRGVLITLQIDRGLRELYSSFKRWIIVKERHQH